MNPWDQGKDPQRPRSGLLPMRHLQAASAPPGAEATAQGKTALQLALAIALGPPASSSLRHEGALSLQILQRRTRSPRNR